MNKLTIIAGLKGLKIMLKQPGYSDVAITSVLVNLANITNDEHLKIRVVEFLMVTNDQLSSAINGLILELEGE